MAETKHMEQSGTEPSAPGLKPPEAQALSRTVGTKGQALALKSKGQAGNLPKVFIYIPVRHASPYLGECLESLRRQSYPARLLEVIVIEENSDEHSRKVVRDFAKSNPAFGFHRRTTKASNSGYRLPTNDDDVVISISPNAVLNEDFVAQSVSCIITENCAASGGRVFYRSKGYFARAAAAVRGSRLVMPTASQDDVRPGERNDGLLYAAYRRAALRACGLLENEMLGNEIEIAMRLTNGGKERIAFSPKIISHVPVRAEIFNLLGMSSVMGMAWVHRVKKQRKSFQWKYAIPGVTLAVAMIAALTLQISPEAWSTFAGMAAVYLLYNFSIALSIAARRRWHLLPVLPFYVAVLHFGFGAGTLAGLIAAKKYGSALPIWIEKLAVIVSDYFAITGSFFLWAYLRSELGLFSPEDWERTFFISNLVFAFWFLLFLVRGLYRAWNAASRLDESFAIFKTVGIGVLIIYLLTFDLEQDVGDPISHTRMLLVSYWFLVAGGVTTGRMILRTVQRRLLENGIGIHRTVIVGWGRKARELYKDVKKYPALGYQVIGFVELAEREGPHQFQGAPVLGRLKSLSEIIRRHQIEEVLIALEKQDPNALVQIIAHTDGLPVSLKIVPDLYSIITGQARTNQIYGFPLIEILPQYMPTWERVTKRLIDMAVSLVILVVGLPFWILVALAIKFDTPGPIFYRQERVGKNGRLFNVLKYRSMVANAEKLTGPKWADRHDPRITRVGGIMRKLRIDEIPQFINVLAGEMSIVGPRPERPYFVELLRKEIPLYPRRLRVQPGITGWAQIKGSYDTTLDDVKQKLQYDLFYLENMSLRMDLKILLHTAYVMLAGRGQ